MTYADIRRIVMRLSWMDTDGARAMRKAFGVEQSERKLERRDDEDHRATERMMRQRYGALDRA